MRAGTVIILLFLVAFATFFMPASRLSEGMVWVYTVMGVMCALLFFCTSERDKNIKMIFLRPSFLFVISYIIVFFQRPIDYLFGYVNEYVKMGDPGFMLMSQNYAVLGLSLFLIGYLFESQRGLIKKSSRLRIPIVSPAIYAGLSSILIFLVLVLVPRDVLLGGYSNDMLTNASIYNYLASWSNAILVAHVLQFTVNVKFSKELEGCSVRKYVKSIGLWQLINVVVYTLIILNVGDRGPLIILAFAYYISYIIVSNRKLSKMRIMIAFCAAICVISILGDTKQYRDNNTIGDRLTYVFENKANDPKESFLPATEQLSGSYCCLPIALQMVSEHDSFGYGVFTFSDLASGLPFSGRIFKFPESTSYRISKYAMGDDFKSGLGTSCLAALYMDGGLLFIIVGMFVFGILLRKFELCIFAETASSFFVFCMAFYFLTHVVYIPRSSLFSPFKYALWMYVVMVVISYIAPQKRA